MPRRPRRPPPAEIEVVRDALEGRFDVEARPMFGGWGVYGDGLFFAIAWKGRLHLKLPADRIADLKAEGARPFVVRGKGGRVDFRTLKYWSVPGEILADARRLRALAGACVEAAGRPCAIRRDGVESDSPRSPAGGKRNPWRTSARARRRSTS